MNPDELPTGITARGFKRMATRAFLDGVNSTGLTKEDRPSPEMLQRFSAKLFRDINPTMLPFAGAVAYCSGRAAALEHLCTKEDCDHLRHTPEAVKHTLELLMLLCGGEGKAVLLAGDAPTMEQIKEYVATHIESEPPTALHDTG